MIKNILVKLHGVTASKKLRVVNKYDMSIHTNPSADDWAKFYIQYHPTADLDDMRGWFANAMMAMSDHLKGSTFRISSEFQLCRHSLDFWIGFVEAEKDRNTHEPSRAALEAFHEALLTLKKMQT